MIPHIGDIVRWYYSGTDGNPIYALVWDEKLADNPQRDKMVRLLWMSGQHSYENREWFLSNCFHVVA